MKKLFKILSLLLVLACIIFYIKIKYDINLKLILEEDHKLLEIKKLKQKQEKLYHSCLFEEVDASLLGNNFSESEKALTAFLSNYDAYVSYQEIDGNYYYGYKDTKPVYGASLIKLVDALYVLDNNIDINSRLKYSSSYYSKSNKGLTQYKVGDELRIDDVVKHALAVSDNGAHKMLIDYIGFNNLMSYGKSLGAKVILTGGDNFGMQTAEDTNVYLKRLYELTLNNESAFKFKEYMINDFHSYLNVNDLKVAHKYGYYDYLFHDIGIVYDIHPYTLSVLTMYGKKDYGKLINKISEKVNEHHNIYWKEKEIYCKNLVYAKK